MIKEKLKFCFSYVAAILFMVLGTVLPAKADYPSNSPPVELLRAYRTPSSGAPVYDPSWFKSGQDACNSAYKLFPPTGNYSGYKWNGFLQCLTVPGSYNGPYLVRTKDVCPYGGSLSQDGRTCVGASGGAVDWGPVCTAGTQITVTYKVIDAKGNYYSKPPIDGYSDGDCRIKLVDVKKCFLGVDGISYCTYVGERSGDPLATSDKVPASVVAPAEQPGSEPVPTNAGSVKDGTACPKGTVPAGFGSDGLISCVGTGSTPKNPPADPKTTKVSTSSTNPDGSITVTTTTIKVNADGSNTTTVDKVTTASAANGGGVIKEQTKDTTPTAGGAPGKETPDKPQEQVNFCKQNPNLAVCRESSVSGTCGQTACLGDAIQCATLRATAAMECRERDEIEELKRMPVRGSGQAIIEGADPQQGAIDAMLKGEEIDLSRPNIDESGFLGGGSCFAPKTFSVAGKLVTVEFGVICDNIQPLRYVVLACAFIVAYLLVSKSVMDAS